MNSEVKSAGRVLDILEYMAGRREAVALSQIVRDLTLPKSSAHGLLQTLAARGHLVQDSAGRYMLIEAGRHGFPFRRHEEPLVVKAMPFMERLRDESGETVLLSAMNAHCDIRRLAKSVSRQPIRYDVNLDAAIVAYCTAMGRVLLAHAPQQTLEDYLSRVQFLSYTPYTITNVQEIRNILIKVRQDGYAINDQEFVTGSTGIAMPVFDATGNVVAALNLGTLTSRYFERHEALLSMLRKTADDISRSLGYRAKP
ncbi:IclR family transcriptional regulator [Agrobacterium rhizogenes]|uniref:IclR family transcriptional regulator n=2 Tax=Rhizobium rhizogenes TaxID=359 RepID=A0AA87Q0V1_RHIRH|nr:IclR family transcriptional regulator [Rhizobium rhizogenes]OCJ01902.1 IclR family transcriptional regulator [Agrobacterium sp. 13-626]OCJ10511.1 IclR family transcriptional regulator [Agrobacterium sp. B131/95]OCJ15354.1 IclR family transcriptional regulator [Agrobacterium sp. B133/95]KEA08977.1 IclR family transcriptional regulator [Rhizobium rhizogenes]MDJ1633760.1 IclR family transcriptional regulator [Rhizobium rhizogenes]